LEHEAKLGDRCDRSSDQDARKPSVEQTNSLNVCARQDGSKGAAEDVGGAQQYQNLNAEKSPSSTGRPPAKAAMEQEPQCDIGGADDEQKTPPDRYWI
jgi:hypothetical protein